MRYGPNGTLRLTNIGRGRQIIRVPTARSDDNGAVHLEQSLGLKERNEFSKEKPLLLRCRFGWVNEQEVNRLRKNSERDPYDPTIIQAPNAHRLLGIWRYYE